VFFWGYFFVISVMVTIEKSRERKDFEVELVVVTFVFGVEGGSCGS
jgi:hypothetical protein